MAGGASTFLALTDTPAAFGTSTQILQVNTGTDALEFVNKPAGGGGGGGYGYYDGNRVLLCGDHPGGDELVS